ncbi:MAG: T9SS type A sorting domain-containing protein, partial [Bacteroidota bacterium]
QTTFDANVVCGGSSCPSYYGSSGSASTYLQVEKPDLELDQLSSSVSDAGTDYVFGIYWVLQNLGSELDAASTTVEFFVDLDSSMTYSAGDRYLGAYSNTISMAAGSSQALNTSLTVPKDSADLSKALIGLVRQSPDPLAGPNQCLCDSLNFAASMDVVLPLVWQEVGATASSNATVVHWVAEVADGSFVVEKRSPKELKWQDLSSSISRQDSSQAYVYEDLDKSVRTYYRIRHTDAAGVQTWSPVVMADRSANWQASIQPNPAHDWVEIVAPAGSTYRLIDTQGQRLRQGALTEGRLKLGLTELPSGIYLIQVEREQQQQSWKLEVR